MKALLFPLAIAMVITLAFGYFNKGLQYSDLVLISLATFAAMAANVVRKKERERDPALQTNQDIL